MTKKSHGRCGYVGGCRCLVCVRANNAYAWACRRAKEWPGSVGESLGSTAEPVFIGRDITLTGEQIREALRQHDRHIKVSALMALWYKLRGFRQ